MKMKYLVTTKKPEENKLIVGSLGKDEIVIKNREFGEYSFSFKNNGEVIVKNGSNGDVIKTKEQFYLNTAGFEYARLILKDEMYKKMSKNYKKDLSKIRPWFRLNYKRYEYELYKKMPEIFLEEWRRAELGRSYYYILDINLNRKENSDKILFDCNRYKKQSMCR